MQISMERIVVRGFEQPYNPLPADATWPGHRCVAAILMALLSGLTLAFLAVLLVSGKVGPSTEVPKRLAAEPATARLSFPATSAPLAETQITLTAAGFDPIVLTVTTGSEVTWLNASGTTHVLRSGVPYQVYLPLLLRAWSGPTTVHGPPRSFPVHGTLGDDFEVTLPPGGTFSHRFETLGQHPYYLATAPHQQGQVIVVVAANQPPQARIATPPNRDWIRGGETLVLVGSAIDPEDGPLSGTSLAWTSDQDGPLGCSAVLTTSLTATGVHTITLTATDSARLTATTQIWLRVPSPGITGGQKPVVPVDQPPLDDPVGLVLNAAETVAYVAEKGTGRLVAVRIDSNSPDYGSITPVALGLEDLQMGLALDPTESYAYVIENAPGKLKRVDLDSGQVVTVASGLHCPHDLALSPDGTAAYLTLDSGALVSVTLATGQVFTVTDELFHPTGLVLAPGGDEAWAASPLETVKVDLSTGARTAYPAGFVPHDLALDPTGSDLYVSSFGQPSVHVVDTATGGSEGFHPLPSMRVDGIAVSASGASAYVLWRTAGLLLWLDLNTWQAEPVLDTLLAPTGVTLNAAGTHAYLLERESGELTRIAVDPSSLDYGRPERLALVGTWEGGGGGLALSADESWALVVKDTDVEPTLLRVDLTTGLTETLTTFAFSNLRGVSLSPNEAHAYVSGNAELWRVDLASGQVTYIGEDTYNWGLNGHALSTDGTTLYVAQRDLHRLFQVDVTSGRVVTITDELHLPVDVALAPGEEAAWMLEEGRGGTLVLVDLASGDIVDEMPLQPWHTGNWADLFATGWTANLALSADGRTAYVASSQDGPHHLFRVNLGPPPPVRLRYRPPMLDVSDLAVNEAETRAYLLDRASQSLYQVDADPASPEFGCLQVLVDGRIEWGQQVALAPGEQSLYVAYHDSLMQIQAADGDILNTRGLDTDWITGLALHPTQPLAYITTNDGSLRQVDLTVTNSQTTWIAGGFDEPRGLTLNAAGTVAYLLEREQGNLLSVTLVSGAVSTVTTGLLPSLDVAVDETNGYAYVLADAATDNPRVTRVRLSTGVSEWVYSGGHGWSAAPAAIALGQNPNDLYVARKSTGALWRVDLAAASAVAIPPSSDIHPVYYHPEPIYEEMERQQGGALSPDGRQLYVGDEFTPRLLSLDLEAGRVSLITGTTWSPFHMAVTADGTTLYHTHHYTDNVNAVDLVTGASHLVPTDSADGLALDPNDESYAYATDGGGEVYRFHRATGARTPLALEFDPWPSSPQALDINGAGTYLYIVPQFTDEFGDFALVRYDLGTDQYETVGVIYSRGDWPANVAVDDEGRYAYVSEQGWGGWSEMGRVGGVRRMDLDPASPTYGQVELVLSDAGELFPLELAPDGHTLIVGGGMAYVILEVD
jgi:DNA-binding beta-propeller fold protein YncE/plastocyanin